MRLSTLLSRNLIYFWRSNLAVVLGVATAVAVLAGALLVGDSVRGSLRDLFLQRLGKTDEVLASTNFFREKLAGELQADSRFGAAFSGDCPLIVLNGLVTDEKSGRRGSSVQVYGVDDRFWRFHGRENQVKPLTDRDVLLSPDLARELGSEAGQTILLRIEKPSAIPAGSLHGRKEDLGRTIRLSFREALAPVQLGEFSLRPSQGAVRAIFVSLARLQKDLEFAGKANTILLAGKSPADIPTASNSSVIADILKDVLAFRERRFADPVGALAPHLRRALGVPLGDILHHPVAADAGIAAGTFWQHGRGIVGTAGAEIGNARRKIGLALVLRLERSDRRKLRRDRR